MVERGRPRWWVREVETADRLGERGDQGQVDRLRDDAERGEQGVTRSHRAVPHALGVQPDQKRLHLRDDVEHDGRGWLAGRDLLQEQMRHVGMGPEVIEVRLHDPQHPIETGALRGGRLGHPVGQRPQRRLEHRPVQGALRAEVIGHRAQVRAGLPGDRPYRRPVEATPREELASGREEVGARGGTALGADAEGGRRVSHTFV